MKTTKWFWLVGAGLFLTLNLLHAQTDSIVQVTAEAQGLGLVAAGDLPVNGTFWLLTSNSAPTPLPFMPAGGDFPVYDLTGEGTQFLVDETDGQAVTNDANSTVAAALAAQADAVVNLINQVQDAQDASLSHGLARAFGMDDGMDMMEDDDSSSGAMMYDTNGLWLELTNISNGWSYLNLHNGTNYVYAILSKTNLPDATWNVETELFPIGDETNVLPFSVQNFDRQNLFLKAEDWTGVTENGNTTPDWWLWEYYGTTALSDTNLDSEGNTLAYDYTNGLVPVAFNFSGMEVTNNYVNTLSPSVQLDVAGSPYYVAISVDDTNYEADANWQNYSSSNVTVNLGMTEGWHEVWIGLRGHGDDAASAVWWRRRLKLDWTPPQVTVTNNLTLDIPLLQLRGFANEDLAGISYDLSNAVVYVTNQDVNLTDRYYDPDTDEFTTNSFEALDIGLTNGVNVITIHATDDAGNTTTTNFSFTLDYSGKTNPPVFVLTWPTNGTQISGSSFTLRGTVADPTVSVSASMVDTNGNTNAFAGLVERDGRFWLENVPLNAGTNSVAITLTDVVGNTSVTNISLVQSSLTLTLNPVSDPSQLWQPTISVSGNVSDTTATIFVNGVQGTNNGDGTWNATNVPVSAGGVASFDLKAIPAGGGDPDANTNLDKPVRLYVESYTLSPWHQVIVDHEDDYNTTDGSRSRNYYDYDIVDTVDSQDGQPGGSHYSSHGVYVGIDETFSHDFFSDSYWPASTWPDAIFVDWSDSGGDYGEETDPPPGGYEIANHADMSLGSYHLYYTNGDTVVDKTKKDTESYDAQTVMKLQTGGKALSQRQNVWRLSASATQLYPGRYKPDGSTIDDVWTTVPAPNITVANKAVGNDGNLWVMLSDNQTVVVTPTVNNVSYYTFGITATKYPFYINLTTSTTNVDLSTTNVPEVCVGQTVTLGADWQGGIPPYTSADIRWSLPGKYVNQPTNYSTTCLTYVKNTDLLTNLVQQCWYVNQPGGACSVREILTFANGQSVTVAAAGSFTVYRPSVNSPVTYAPYGAAISGGLLSLEDGTMRFDVTINSKYPGNFGLTQLVKMYSETVVIPPDLLVGSTTFGNFDLDGGQYYDGPKGQDKTCSINDTPGQPLLFEIGDYTGHWQDYVRFTPNGGIPVTLGRIDWNWAATCENPDPTIGWFITSDGVDGPTQPSGDDSFPLWQFSGLFPILE